MSNAGLPAHAGAAQTKPADALLLLLPQILQLVPAAAAAAAASAAASVAANPSNRAGGCLSSKYFSTLLRPFTTLAVATPLPSAASGGGCGGRIRQAGRASMPWRAVRMGRGWMRRRSGSAARRRAPSSQWCLTCPGARRRRIWRLAARIARRAGAPRRRTATASATGPRSSPPKPCAARYHSCWEMGGGVVKS